MNLAQQVHIKKVLHNIIKSIIKFYFLVFEIVYIRGVLVEPEYSYICTTKTFLKKIVHLNIAYINKIKKIRAKKMFK